VMLIVCFATVFRLLKIRIHEYGWPFINSLEDSSANQQLYLGGISWLVRRSGTPLLYRSALSSEEILNGRGYGRGHMPPIL